MPRDPRQLSDAEWTLMRSVWRLGRATVRDIHDEVVEETGWAYTTVKTMLERLADKGLLTVRKVGPVKEFKPARRKSDVVRRALEGFLDRVLGDDSLDPLVTYIARSRQLDEDDVEALRRMLDDDRDDEEGAR